jgi:hypothetical protein
MLDGAVALTRKRVHTRRIDRASILSTMLVIRLEPAQAIASFDYRTYEKDRWSLGTHLGD